MNKSIKNLATYGKTEAIMLRTGVYVIGAGLLAICFALIPELAREESVQNPEAVTYPYMLGAYLLLLPVFFALYQVHKLAGYVEKGRAITADFVSSLRTIKLCAVAFSVLVIIGAALTIVFARASDPSEDVTHIFALGFIFTFASSVIAAIAALFQQLIQKAVDLKSENELTV